jgi:hypothetical protein
LLKWWVIIPNQLSILPSKKLLDFLRLNFGRSN